MTFLNVLWRHSLCGIAIAMGCESFSLGQTAELQTAQNYADVSRWIVEVIGSGGRVDQKLGEFATYLEASDVAVKWSEDHPSDLRLARPREVKVRVYSPSPNKPQSGIAPPPTSKPVEAQMLDRREGKATEDEASLANKTIRGTFGSTELEVELKKDGSSEFRDPDTGEVIAEGKWSQTGTALSMETQTYRYMGLVTANGLEGKRIKRGDGSSTETWKGSVAKSKPRVQVVPLPVENAVVGTWGIVSDGGGLTSYRYEFYPNGSVTISGSTSRGSWKMIDANNVVITFSKAVNFKLNGDRMDAEGWSSYQRIR